MEHYKFNMAECCHAGMWQEDILGKTCLDCGFNTYHNDCGMYNDRETKGIVTRINEEMERLKPKVNFAEYLWQKEFKKAYEKLWFCPFNIELNTGSENKRTHFIFTKLNPEE